METTTCVKCGQTLSLGDWPFCPHGSTFSVNALRFSDPILIHQSVTNPDDFSFPGTNTEACPAGYREIRIENIQQANHWTNEINRVESTRTNMMREVHKQYWDEQKKAKREQILSRIKGNRKAEAMFEAVRRFADAKREARYRGQLDSHFHIQAIEFDNSNRQPHASERTGWKDRRV